jgi:hypothetical protein
MGKAHLKLVTPAKVKRTVTPKRPANAKLRTREYLTEAEIARLMAAASRRAGSDVAGSGPPAMLKQSLQFRLVPTQSSS